MERVLVAADERIGHAEKVQTEGMSRQMSTLFSFEWGLLNSVSSSWPVLGAFIGV